jgi:hypothetical protein
MASLTLTVTYDAETKRLRYSEAHNLEAGLTYIPTLPEPVFIVNRIPAVELNFNLVDGTGGQLPGFELKLLGMAAWALGHSPRPWIVLAPAGRCGPLEWSTDTQRLTLNANFEGIGPAGWTCRLVAQATYPRADATLLSETIVLDPKIYNEGGG